MWGNYAQPVPLPPRRTGSGLRISAVVLLVLAAALTLGGSFAPVLVSVSDYVSPSSPPSPSTYTRSAWVARVDPPTDTAPSQPLDGYLLAVGMVLVLAAVVVLLTSGRRPGGREWGRAAGVGAAALLVGAIGQTWLSLSESLISAAQEAAAQNPDSGSRYDLFLGAGAWLQLTAAACAIAAAVLLLVSARSDALRPAGWAVRP